MITVSIRRDQHERLTRIRIQGHAEFAEHGKDIVCAAVSAISIGSVNAIEKLLEVQVVSPSSEAGDLDVRVPAVADQAVYVKLQLLLEAMVIALEDVATAYPAYIEIK